MTTVVPVTASPCGLEYSIHREHRLACLLSRLAKQSPVYLATMRRVPAKALARGHHDLPWLDGRR